MPRRLLLAASALLGVACVDGTRDLPTPARDAGEGGVIIDAGPPLIDAGEAPPTDAADAGCLPPTCQHLGAECGVFTDDCGNRLDCGVCGAAWTRMSDEGAPGLRRLAASVFDGEGLVIWGGTDGRGPPSPVGARYHASTDTWSAMSTVDAPPPTLNACAVRYRGDVLVFGGIDLTASPEAMPTNRGGLYDPDTDAWRPFPLEGAPLPRTAAGCGVIGDVLYVAGGARPEDNVGAALDLNSWTWRPLSAPPVDLSFTEVEPAAGTLIFSAEPWARIDPEDVWSVLPSERSPRASTHMGIAWTGDGLFVFGGAGPGAQRYDGLYFYDAPARRWTQIEAEDGPGPRAPLVTAWTGDVLLLFGCLHGCQGGFQFDPETTTWRRMPFNQALNRLDDAYGAWTGEELLVVPAGPAPTGTPSRGWRYRP